jgi:hypothetical protein
MLQGRHPKIEESPPGAPEKPLDKPVIPAQRSPEEQAARDKAQQEFIKGHED